MCANSLTGVPCFCVLARTRAGEVADYAFDWVAKHAKVS
jgi:hypothetical protein